MVSTVGDGAVPTSKLVRSFEVVRSRGSSAGSETKSKVLVVSTLNAADMPVLLLVTVKSVDDPDAVIVLAPSPPVCRDDLSSPNS